MRRFTAGRAIGRRAALFGTVAALAAPHVARAAVRTVRLACLPVANSAYGMGCAAVAEAVAAHPVLSGVLRVDIRNGGEAGDELAITADCRRSTLDMVMVANVVMGAFCPEAGLLDTPFIFKDGAHARAALDGAIGAEYAALLKAKDINVLAWCEVGLRHITANRPIRSPADLQGLKLRVPQSEIIQASFRAMGADANPLPASQIFEALRTGAIEAQENPITIIEAFKFAEVQKYLILTGHIYSAGMLCASPDLLEDLAPAQLSALQDCAARGAAKTREVVADAERAGVARLRQAGMVVVDQVDTAAFAQAARPATAALGAKYGAERMQRLVSAGS